MCDYFAPFDWQETTYPDVTILPAGVDVPAPAPPLQQHNAGVRSVLLQRGTIYAAQGDDHITGGLAHSLYCAVRDGLHKQSLSHAQSFYIAKLCEKAARAITGALGGVYHGDNGLDLSGYEALLASVSSGKPLADVLPI